MSAYETPSQLFFGASRLIGAAAVMVVLGAWQTQATAQEPAVDKKMPAELAALDAQFQQLQNERVTAPFDAEIAKLNSAYLGSIDKSLAAEQSAGNLDGVLALKAEKDQFAVKPSVPESDDASTPQAVKNLRGIYRATHAKHAAAREENLKALAEPLAKRLAQLETELTKAQRLEDAVAVRGYREALGGGAVRAAAVVSVPATVQPATALVPMSGFTNNLGMKFVPVKGTAVLFCIHETRYKDYAAYAVEVSGVDESWKDQRHDGFAITDRKEDHPVKRVSWEDAQKFCLWLSQKEGRTYRLPTDEEWSAAVGIAEEEKRSRIGATPEQISAGVRERYPWGKKWPPPKDAGNYSDQTRKEKVTNAKFYALPGYADGYPVTAPVMSFRPNELGIYDLGGNVQEWCEDWYDRKKTARVTRGASFGLAGQEQLLSSARGFSPPESRMPGFRVVVVISPGGR